MPRGSHDFPEWDAAIRAYLDDMGALQRITSVNTVLAYRRTLELHAEDAEARGVECVKYATRNDVKRTLERWTSSSRVRAHSVLRSFYRWCIEEDLRVDNPAEQVRQTRRKNHIHEFRLTQDEVVALMDAAITPLERRIVYFGTLTGGRATELTLLRVSHLARTGSVHFSRDITKGGRERWVPVLPELEPIVREVIAGSRPEAFVLPGRHQTAALRRGQEPSPITRIYVHKVLRSVVARAGVDPRTTPHTLRHAFAAHLLRQTRDLHLVQHLLGHASVSTTATIYVGKPSLDDMASGVVGFSYREAA